MKVRLSRFMKPSQTIEVEPGTTLLAFLPTLGLDPSVWWSVKLNPWGGVFSYCIDDGWVPNHTIDESVTEILVRPHVFGS